MVVLYRPNSENARSVEEFVHEFKRVHNIDADFLSMDTREGAAMASLYDIVQLPAIFVTQDDGSVAQLWSGETLPLMSEVAAYMVGYA